MKRTELEMRAALIAAARDMAKAHCTDFEPANRWAELDRERMAGDYSAEVRFARLDEVQRWTEGQPL